MDDSTTTVAVGDALIVELMFNNSIEHANPGNSGLVEHEGWAGEKPSKLFTSINYTRTDSIKNLIKKHGNTLTYDLISLTTGAILSPLTPDGPNVDEDRDGISDTWEKGAGGNNSTWDGNSDGIPDYQQANVASFHTFDGLNYVTMVVPSGTELSQVKVTDNPSPSDTPANAEFPWGFFDFSIDGLDPGEAVTVTLILHNGEPADKYYKYGMTPDNPEPHWYDFTYDGQTGAQINSNVITLHFVDGLRGDEDITENCSIKEPGGPVLAGTTGITDLIEKRGIKVYPNPASDFITLRLNNVIPANDYIIHIHSITGALVHQKAINVIEGNQEFTVPVEHLPEGIYMITLSWNNYSYKSKFIKH